MEKHKDKALEDQCLCDKCPHKFECFTQERIFSDPVFQGLFEALMAQGSTKEDALKRVIGELEARIRLLGQGTVISPWIGGGTASVPNTNPYWTWDTTNTTNTTDVPWTYTSGTYVYHMMDGDNISWTASDVRLHN